MEDDIIIISPVKKEPKPFFIPRDPNKPKPDLSGFIRKPLPKQTKLRLTPIQKKNTKDEEKKTATKNLTKALAGSDTTSKAKIKPGQTKIDMHLKWKDGKAPDVVEIAQPKTPPLAPTTVSHNYRTPSPRRRLGRSPSPEYSPLPPAIAAQLKASLESPGFLARKDNALKTVLERAKENAKLHPKCKFSRKLMNGYECACCKDYYDAMDFENAEARQEYVNKVSKHRGWEEAPPTPPRYWDLDIPDAQEQVRLGYVIETDSPLIKNKKKKK